MVFIFMLNHLYLKKYTEELVQLDVQPLDKLLV